MERGHPVRLSELRALVDKMSAFHLVGEITH